LRECPAALKPDSRSRQTDSGMRGQAALLCGGSRRIQLMPGDLLHVQTVNMSSRHTGAVECRSSWTERRLPAPDQGVRPRVKVKDRLWGCGSSASRPPKSWCRCRSVVRPNRSSTTRSPCSAVGDPGPRQSPPFFNGMSLASYSRVLADSVASVCRLAIAR
jgi:hypothetical protein